MKALGYLSSNEEELDERIQMHADKLYHQMLAQEAAIAEAKASGQLVNSLPPVLSSTFPTNATKSQSLDFTNIKPDARAQIQKRLKGLDPSERFLEEQAIIAEVTAGLAAAGQVTRVYDEKKQGKKKKGDQD